MRMLAVALVAVSAVALSACSQEPPTKMPDVVGKRLDEARSDVKRAGVDDDIEIVGGGVLGILNESNWTVCSQIPEAGTSATVAPRLSVERKCDSDSMEATPPNSGTSSPSSTGASDVPTVPRYGDTVPYMAYPTRGEPISLSVTVSAPTKFTPRDRSSATQAENVFFTVRIKNTGKETFQLGLDYAISGLNPEDPQLDEMSGHGVEGDQIFGDDQLKGNGGGAAVKPGRTLTYQVGFSVADSKDVTFKMRPYGLGGDSIYWTR